MDQPTGTPQTNKHRPLWDVFCHVVDNLGDIGVCWRLAVSLAHRGQRLRLWIDQPEPLRWMAPGALEGDNPWIKVIPWTTPLPAGFCESLAPAQVWVETFGCHPPDEAQTALAGHLAKGVAPPVWINLEYLSAESYVERSHGLPSPVMSGPLKGLGKWFIFPGFTVATGGLLREPGLEERRGAFHAAAWRARMGIPLGVQAASLFCYEPQALEMALLQSAQQLPAVHWLITPGRAATAVQILRNRSATAPWASGERLHALPLQDQMGFDELLWACDLNFVRGEDSLVRALWAGNPFVWQLYPQDDGAHLPKLEAFLDWLQAPDSLRRFHLVWNGAAPAEALVWPDATRLAEWKAAVESARTRLLALPPLDEQLLKFVEQAATR